MAKVRCKHGKLKRPAGRRVCKKAPRRRKGPQYAKTRKMPSGGRAKTSPMWRRDFDEMVNRGERESAKTQMMGARRRRR